MKKKNKNKTKQNGASTASKPMASAVSALRCSTNWAIKSHTFAEGQLF